jgi:hypothetical protein
MSVIVTVVSVAVCAAFNQTFSDANAAYEAGKFAEAAKLYEKLVASSVENPVVFYNLGNAYYRQGDEARAIANYERALALNPRFDSARENLEKTLGATKRNLARPLPPQWEQSLFFWHYAISYRLARALAIVFWVVFWSLLAFRYARPKRYLRAAALAAFVLSCVFSGSAWLKAHPTPLAVALHDGTPVRFGRSDSETVRFELFEGDRVNVDRRINNWVRVETVSGERGWVRDDALIFVGPPYTTAIFSPETSASPTKNSTS